MKRVLCILSSLNAGGAETFMMKIYRALPLENYQMDFVVSQENGVYTKEVLDRGGRIFFAPLRTKAPVGNFMSIRKVVRENSYQYVLKLGNSPISVVDLIAAKMGGARVLAMRSCNAPVNLSRIGRIMDAVFRPILNVVANVKLAPSDLAAQYTFGEKAYARGEVCLLNNAVDLDVFSYDLVAREQIRREFSITDKVVIGHIGRFNKQKNHSFLLEIFQQIQRKNANTVLLLVGVGELENEIRQKAQQLGIVERIIFTGLRSDVPRLLSAMDVFVFPSFHEGMPNTVIEAQATGLPCVIADTITRTADITGLVEYLPLTTPAADWADCAIKKASLPRRDTHEEFIREKYDIGSSVDSFIFKVFGR